MTTEPTPPPAVRSGYLTGQRQDLHAWMLRNASPLADLYLGALELLFGNGSSIPGRARFIAHAVREIANRLPDVLAGPSKGRYDPSTDLDQLVQKWKRAHLSEVPALDSDELRTPPVSLPLNVPIPRPLYRAMEKLLKKWETSRETKPQKMRSLFMAAVPEHRIGPESLEPSLRQWTETIDYFASVTHENLKRSVDMDELTRRFELFEHSLATLVGSFYKSLNVLDEILGKANS